MIRHASKPPPHRTPTTAPFWDGLSRGQLLIQVCDQCGLAFHYPRKRCPRCWADDVRWTPASGQGTIVSFTLIHRPGHPAWLEDVPYVVAIVALAEGPWVLSNVDAEGAQLSVGLAVQATYRHHGDASILAFRPRRE